jgi:hypothetical protein
MTFNLIHALATALDDGCSLDELETTLLKGSDTDDRIAAAWLYAWAYDEIRPPRDDLAARITSGTPHLRLPCDPSHPTEARDPPTIRATHTAPATRLRPERM